MGFDPKQALILAGAMLAQPAMAQTPGWHYSPLPGEGDRASMGCARDSTDEDFTCLVVRCEDDFSTGIHVHSSLRTALGNWEMTIDRENREVEAVGDEGPYSARMVDEEGWLLDRLRQGTFVYLRRSAETDPAFDYIALSGSYRAIHDALYWCAPRSDESEQKTSPNVDGLDSEGEEE